MPKIDSIRLDGTNYDIERGMLPRVVSALPETGNEDTMYLVPSETPGAITETATGDYITISDGMAGAPLSLTELDGNATQSGTPTPDAPVAINTVTGEQVVGVVGKNLFGIEDAPAITQNGITISVSDGAININGTATASFGVVIANLKNGIVFKNGMSYTLSKESSGSVNGYWALQFRDANGGNIVETNPYLYLTTISNASGTAKAIRLYIASGRKFTNYSIKIQLELGSTATAYEPYHGQEFSIDLGSIELAKIGTYQDRIYKDDGKWYIEKQVGKVVLDGTNAFRWGLYGTGTPSYFYYYQSIVDALIAPNSQMSNYAQQTNIGTTGTDQGFTIVNNGLLRLRYGAEMSIEDWKAKITANPMVVYYALVTPTTTEITDETLLAQLNFIASLYGGVNNISLVGTGAQGAMTVQYEAIDQTKKYDEYVWVEDDHAYELVGQAGAIQQLQRDVSDINDELLSRAVVFDTVADMQASSNLINGSFAQTLGYHAINDGGKALYKIRTISNDEVADEATLIALGVNNLVAELIFTTNINPITFGAYGDGTHDDVNAIQNAINYACDHSGVISFNSGRYNISDSLTIPSAIKIEGTYAKGDSTTSIKGTEILVTSNNKPIFKLNSGVSYYQCEFRNLRLNASDTTGCKGFDTTGATFVSECIFDTIYFNGQFDIALDAQKTTLTTIRNCLFSSNNVGINISSTFSGNYIENCNFWNNTQDVNATGTLENVYFDKCHFENTGNHTSMTFKAPISLSSCAIRDCEYLANSSDYAIFFDGTNTSSFVRLTGFYIENTNITAKTGIKIDMTGNTANNNALTDTFLNYVTFLRCTGYGVDTNYQYTGFVLINCLCFNNWYYGNGTMTNQTTPNRIKTFSFKNGFDVDTSINFKYLNSLSYSANSLYLNANDVLTWRFSDTSKTAPIAMIKLGSTANRPSSPLAGEMYYDWTLTKPIWWTGTAWIDATGTTV